MSLFTRLFGKKKRAPGVTVTVTYDPPEQHVHIITDSLKLMETTLNPTTYFSRYKLASNEALSIFEYPLVIYEGMTANKLYDMLYIDRDSLHQKFIDRLFAAGKEDRLVYQMYEVASYMSFDTRAYFLEKLNGKKYHFCKVRFNSAGKLYTYVTQDASVEVGDTITVPTGNGVEHDYSIVQVAEVYDDSLNNLAFPIEELRCVEKKLKSIPCPNCGQSIKGYKGNGENKVCTCEFCGTQFYFVN